MNDTELLRLPHYQIRQTVAQSKRLYEYTSGKLKKNSQKIFRLCNFGKSLKLIIAVRVENSVSGPKSKSPKSFKGASREFIGP